MTPAAERLGPVQCFVRKVQQLRRGRALGRGGNSNGNTGLRMDLGKSRLRDLEHALGNAHRNLVAGIRKDYGKLVSANSRARSGFGVSEAGTNLFCSFIECLVAA